ncbi:ParB/RepB/Spo0J family partition protein [Deinococcus hohokamensis]|uniref:ParB/RepB/Spo0J family partition protein n=1 Tax=Deinococcus hohokamensis TaxID=309883 RepID=A0ABV9I6D7_9DEIO
MTRKRPERKRDLAGLLGEDVGPLRKRNGTTAAVPGTVSLPVTALRPGRHQPRRQFDQAALEALAASLRTEGVLQPLLVRPVEGGHEIVAGERRWRAAELAGLTEVPVLVRELDDRQARAAALIENLQRQDLNVIDEIDGKLGLVAVTLGLEQEAVPGRLMQLLHEAPSKDQAELEALFAPLGESWQSFAKNKLRILNWPPQVVEALRAGLPRTLAALIVSAPEEHHASLIAQAQGGATRAELRAAVDALARQPRRATNRAAMVAKRLASRRFMAGLSPEDQKALDRWLAKMPAFLENEAQDD